jgi:hypothetical protein
MTDIHNEVMKDIIKFAKDCEFKHFNSPPFLGPTELTEIKEILTTKGPLEGGEMLDYYNRHNSKAAEHFFGLYSDLITAYSVINELVKETKDD